MRSVRHTLLLLGIVGLAVGSPAQAQSPYTLDAEVDVPVMLLGLSLSTLAFIDTAPPDCLPMCDASEINAFDRGVLGNYNPDFYTAADIGLYTLLGMPLLLNAIDSEGDGWFEDTAVFLEVILVTQGVTQLVKSATRREAPLVYDPSVSDAEKRGNTAASRSFWSGHTATAFAAATAYATTYWKRHPNDDARWVVIGVGAALATFVAVSKVEAGYHYWTDILAGAGAGIAFGLIIPALHD